MEHIHSTIRSGMHHAQRGSLPLLGRDNGYRGLSLLFGLNLDRFLSAGAILIALSGASILVNLFL